MKRIQFIRVWLIALLLFVFHNSEAANLYWYGHTNTTFSTASNWSTINTGYSAAGAAPGSSDVANYGNYTGITNANCSLSGAINIQGINFVAGYTGTFTQGANAITIGTGNAVFSAGTFTGGSSAITVTGSLTISGATATFTSTSNTLTVSGNFVLSSGTFTHNSGTVLFDKPNTITGTISFNNLTFNPGSAGSYTISNTITANGTLTLAGSNTITLNTGTIDTKSTITDTNTGTSGGGTATITITGTASPTLTGSGTVGQGNLPKVTINKSSGTLTLASIISVANNWTWTAGTLSLGTSTVAFVATCSITGSHTLNNVTFSSNSTSTFTVANTLTVNGTLTIAGSGSLTFNTGTIDTKSTITVTNTGTGGGGTATISITGTASPTLTGSGTVGQGNLPKITINKSSGTLTLASIISVANDWTWTAGTLSLGTSTVAFMGTCSITGSHTLFNVTFSSSATSTYTIVNTLTVNGTLTIAGTGSLTFNTGTIDTKGDVTVTNTGTAGGGSATISLTGTGTPVTLTGSGTSGQGILPKVTVNKSSGTLNLASIISFSSDLTFTAATVSSGTSTVVLKATSTLTVANSGGTSFYKLSFAPSATATYTITSTTTITVSNLLSFDGTAAITLNTGTINLTGNFTINNTIAGGGGSATININGTGAQTFTGNGAANTGLTPNITIDKLFSSGTLTLSSTVIACGGNWTYVKGWVDATTNSTGVAMNGNKNLDGQGTDSTMTFYKVNIQSGTTTLTGNLIAANSVVLTSGTTFLGNGFNINLVAKWNNLGATWTPGSGTVTFYGNSLYGFISKTGGSETFGNLTINKASSGVKLFSQVDVTGTLTLTNGRVTTTTTNYLDLIAGASVSGGSNASYVNGPMRKKGNTLFSFPIGDSTISVPYHPLKISAPASSSDQFEAIYKPTVQTSGSTLGTGIASISTCEYWTLERKAGTSTPTVSLSWNSNCDNGSYSEMRVVTWTGSQWSDLGQASVTPTSPTGTVDGSSAETFGVNPAPLTIGYATAIKSFAIIKKTLDGGCCLTEGKVLYFAFDEEYKDADNLLTYKITNLSTDRDVTMSSSIGNVATDAYGNNRYKIDLYDNTNTALPSGYYMLEVTNEKNEKWYLRFKI